MADTQPLFKLNVPLLLVTAARRNKQLVVSK
jgi:hypothetical protein